MKKFILSAILLLLAARLCAQVLYQAEMRSENDLDGFTKDAAASVSAEGLVFSLSERNDYRFIMKKFEPTPFNNRLLRISCEIQAENILPKEKTFDGIKCLFSMDNGVRKTWGEIAFPDGSFDWRKFETFIATLPDLKKIELAIGMQNSAGTFRMRNLKVETAGVPVQIRSVANMALKDEIAGDGKGGWTDQGPGRDGRCFFGNLYSKSFAGIPIDAEPEGNGVLVMNSKHFEAGPPAVDIPVVPAEKAKSLYLLHTLAWGPALFDKRAGSIVLRDRCGREQRIPVVYNHDVADWYRNIATLPNGYAALRGRTDDGEVAAVYLSRFEVAPEMGEIVSVGFRSNPESIWLIFGATLSEETVPLPEAANYKITADDRWLPLARPAENRIQPGSALDLSSYMLPGTVDELGRIVIRDGHFVFEKQPERKVRFLTEAMHPQDVIPADHVDIERFAAEIRRNGYNMVRTHFLDTGLMAGMDGGEFNAAVLDRIDYFIACMKKNGIYLNFDCMTSWIGYTSGNIHQNNDPVKSFKSRIFFDPEVRQNWREGVEKFLCHVNPYTGMRLVDDPVLVMAVAYNEQEFGFWRDFDTAAFLPAWREFLKKKYGSIDRLHVAWKKDSAKFKSFDEISCFKGYNGNYVDADVAEFLYPYEKQLLAWYEKQMREMGYKGYLVNYNCGKALYFNLLRSGMPLVAMNHYYAHPSAWANPHSFICQRSGIGEKAITFRNFIGTRQPGKPFVVTEQNFVFWNQFRYEQGFVIGGYSAFQDFDALTVHASPVSFNKIDAIAPFLNCADPVAKVSEFLTFFLFIRQDVTSSVPVVRIRAQWEDVFTHAGVSGTLSAEQSLPALLVGESVECTEDTSSRIPLYPGEIAYRLGTTSSAVVNNAGFSGSEDNPAADSMELLDHLRKVGAVSADNRSNGKNIFENSTKELYLDSSRNYMQINTPRLQGVCALAGTTVELPDFRIESMSTNGNLAVVSVDGMKPLYEAGRMVLVYSTNVLNSGMEFSDSSMITLLNNGHEPALLERGSFSVGIRNRVATSLKLYPLDLAGKRLKELVPQRIQGEWAWFSVDTGRDGAAIWFEISGNRK